MILFLGLLMVVQGVLLPSSKPSPAPIMSRAPTVLSLVGSQCELANITANFTGDLCIDNFCRPGYTINFVSSQRPYTFRCEPCAAGFFAPGMGSPCRRCPIGTFTNVTGSTDCIPCPYGYYSDLTGGTFCNVCASGSIVDKEVGATICEECKPGSYSDVIGAQKCTSCSPGTIAARGGAIACTNCSAGTAQSILGAMSCQSCAPGEYSSEASSNCTQCPAGMYSGLRGSASCTNCSAGTFAPFSGSGSCQDCLPGAAVAVEGSSKCPWCPAGRFAPYSGSKQCTACPVGYYQPSQGAQECLQAPHSYTTIGNASASIVCDVGYYEYDNGKNKTCEQCLTGMKCTDKDVTLKDGYWRLHENSAKIFSCRLNGCSGGNFSNSDSDDLCKVGYEGPVCAVCSENYYEDLLAGSCLSCEGSNVSVGFLAFLASLGVVVVVGLFFAFRCTTSCTTISLKLVYNVLRGESSNFTANTGKHFLDKLSQRCSKIFSSMKPKAKILFITLQIIAGFVRNVDVDIPANFLSFLSVLSFLNIDTKSVFPLYCWFSNSDCVRSYFKELLIMTLVPIGLCLLMVPFYYFFVIYERSRHVSQPSKERAEEDAYVLCFKIFLGITYVVFPPVSSKLVGAFHYDYYNDENAGITDQCYLNSALCVKCSDPFYEGVIVPYALFMLLIYPIGIPLMYFVLLYRYHDEIVSRSIERVKSLEVNNSYGVVRKGTSGSKSLSLTGRGLSVLYGLYLPSCAYFEIFECFRRLSLSSLMIYYMPNSPFQCVLGILICVASLRVYASYQPFIEKPNSIIAELCQWQIFGTLVVFLLIKTHVVESSQYVIAGIFLLLINIGAPLISILIGVINVSTAYEDQSNGDPSRDMKANPYHQGDVIPDNNLIKNIQAAADEEIESMKSELINPDVEKKCSRPEDINEECSSNDEDDIVSFRSTHFPRDGHSPKNSNKTKIVPMSQ